MQEKPILVHDTSQEVITRQVQLCIAGKRMWLQGQWQWELQSEAVFCSDVMSFPDDFVGTKSIIHPDDVAHLKSALKFLQDGEVVPLEFRIITTYGEVKTIRGEQVAIDLHEPLLLPDEERQPWEEVLTTWQVHKEDAYLKLRTELSDTLERLYGFGSWYINADTNESFYSDNMFRIHGLAAQSLNAHANTFNAFFHPEDQVVVTEALDKAYARHVPVHLEYRIVRPDGTERNVQLVTQWQYNYRGHRILTGLLQDVTEKNAENGKQAQKSIVMG